MTGAILGIGDAGGIRRQVDSVIREGVVAGINDLRAIAAGRCVFKRLIIGRKDLCAGRLRMLNNNGHGFGFLHGRQFGSIRDVRFVMRTLRDRKGQVECKSVIEGTVDLGNRAVLRFVGNFNGRCGDLVCLLRDLCITPVPASKKRKQVQMIGQGEWSQ